MGIHVTRSSRGTAPVRFARHPGEKVRPRKGRPGKSGGKSGGAQTSAQTGGSSGAAGNFGEDFE